MQTHAPPLTLVMKRGGWTIGESNTTTLVNKAGEEVSERTSKKERAIVGTTSYGTSSQMYSRMDGDGSDGQEKCAIM